MKKPKKKNYRYYQEVLTRVMIRDCSEIYDQICDVVHPDVTDQVEEATWSAERLFESQISRIKEQLHEKAQIA